LQGCARRASTGQQQRSEGGPHVKTLTESEKVRRGSNAVAAQERIRADTFECNDLEDSSY
jgi:hypothetical protein